MILLSSCLILSVVFLWSAASKMRDRQNVQKAFSTLGVPFGLTGAFVNTVIGAELVAAALLVIPRFRLLGSSVSILLLLVFTCVIIGNLVVGNAAHCACFGGSSKRPISKTTVARNLMLLAVSVGITLALVS